MSDINVLRVLRQQSVGPPADVAGGEQLTAAAPPEVPECACCGVSAEIHTETAAVVPESKMGGPLLGPVMLFLLMSPKLIKLV